MLSNYIVHTKNLYSFYHRHGDILYRVHENGKWGKESALFRDARESYTVSLDADGVIYLFCQDNAGDMILCTNKDGTFKPKPILTNRSNKIYTLQMNPIITRDEICLVYNLPDDGANYLALQRSEGGAWSQPTRIDRFMSMNDGMFALQQVSGEHHILFYQSRGEARGETSLGYREITPARQGRYHAFHNAGYAVADTSFLVTDDAIHVLYVVRGLFSSQLVYRRKKGDAFGEPLILCEAQRLENVLLWFAGGRLWAAFVNAEQLYVCVSEDRGDSFSRPERYRNKFCVNPAKAVYVSAEPMDERKFYLRQVYVDSDHPYDIQLLPDLCDDFFPVQKPPPTSAEDDLRGQVETLAARIREQEYQISVLTELLQKQE